MLNIRVRDFNDLLAGQPTASIFCLITGQEVRRFTVLEGGIEMRCMNGETITVQLDTPIAYQPWCMDRGSLVFGPGNQMKVCTEADIIRYPNDVEGRVMPPEEGKAIDNQTAVCGYDPNH